MGSFLRRKGNGTATVRKGLGSARSNFCSTAWAHSSKRLFDAQVILEHPNEKFYKADFEMLLGYIISVPFS
jgi:hypothetical protein